MALSHLAAPSASARSFVSALLYFAMRTLVAVAIASAVWGVMQHQAGILSDESYSDHPIWDALRSVDAGVLQTEIVVWASNESERLPSYGELKSLARNVAGGMYINNSDNNYWSDMSDGYRVVYFQGSEDLGGKWIASASYLIEGWPRKTTTAVSLHRVIYGSYADLKSAINSGKSHVRRASRGSGSLSHKIKVSARPGMELDAETMARTILATLGADVRLIIESDEDGFLLAGYAPKLPGSARVHGQEINVEVRISKHGIGQRIDLGYPRL